jgi:hypothetical protein
MTAPTNGVDRCPCGCKYWTCAVSADGTLTPVNRCFDCDARFDPTYGVPQPTDVGLDAAFIDSVEDVLFFQFGIDAGKTNAMARAIVEALEA